MFPHFVIMALGNKKFEEADKEQNFELKTGNTWRKILIWLREETLCVASNKFKLDCLRINGLQQL